MFWTMSAGSALQTEVILYMNKNLLSSENVCFHLCPFVLMLFSITRLNKFYINEPFIIVNNLLNCPLIRLFSREDNLSLQSLPSHGLLRICGINLVPLRWILTYTLISFRGKATKIEKYILVRSLKYAYKGTKISLSLYSMFFCNKAKCLISLFS